MPLNKYRERAEEDVCQGCKFFPTKPEGVPEEIAEYVGIALELSELERGGSTFNYPDALSPLEWTCLKALTRGKDRADTLKTERDRRERRLAEKKKGLSG